MVLFSPSLCIELLDEDINLLRWDEATVPDSLPSSSAFVAGDIEPRWVEIGISQEMTEGVFEPPVSVTTRTAVVRHAGRRRILEIAQPNAKLQPFGVVPNCEQYLSDRPVP